MPDDILFDQQHLWHPYSSMSRPQTVYKVQSADGVRITLDDGRELIDGMASWWSVIHGYNHPTLNAAIENQLQQMAHVMFGGLTHQPAIDLGRQLIALTPAPLQHVFYADSGSVAVEVAIKMALQYWHSQGRPEKNRLLGFMHGYHGDTFAAMSVTDPVNGMHQLFGPILASQVFAPAPATAFGQPAGEADLADLKQLLAQHHQQLAAVIIEPIVQGAGGMRFYSADYLRQLRQLCDDYQVLLIADEIATGFGRTGELFACNHAGISPDILCLGKALTGGYLSFAATLCSSAVATGISDGEAGVFMHGPTFMANPLACAVANASLDLLQQNDWRGAVQRIEAQLQQHLLPSQQLPVVADVRVLGAIGVIELQQPVDMAVIQPALVDAGIWVRPFGRLVYIMPPYVIDNNDLAFLCTRIIDVLKQLYGE
ncbi:MAG TPA: adenosylmethionine--8-amino-7-oxononanoate transaminase [Pseudomonadales bacterium]